MRYNVTAAGQVMKLPIVIFTFALAMILLVIAIPFGLVQLDIMAAKHLRLVPSVITIILGLAFLATAIAQLRRKRRDQ